VASKESTDPWADWVLKTASSNIPWLATVRDRLLDAAQVGEGKTILDVGSGEGLIANGALARGASVIFSDVSPRLLEHCEEQLRDSPTRDRARFICASADDLQPIASESVDIVTSRSVLIYLNDKAAALGEIFRVLNAGGYLSAFEPINSFGRDWEGATFCGYEVADARDLAARVRGRWEEASTSLLNFSERDLLRCALDAGFTGLTGTLEVELSPGSWLKPPWADALDCRPNPLAPTLREAIDQALSRPERQRFEAVLRPLVEGDAGRQWKAGFYLLAQKSD
jgi:arsenite methyltransferase